MKILGVVCLLSIATLVPAQSRSNSINRKFELARPAVVSDFFGMNVQFPTTSPGPKEGQSLLLTSSLEAEGRLRLRFNSRETIDSPTATTTAPLGFIGSETSATDKANDWTSWGTEGIVSLLPANRIESERGTEGTLGMIIASSPRALNTGRPERVAWKPLALQSLYFLGVMHSYRIATEPSTRAGMRNPLVGGYFQTLGAMHGWSDGDGYYENYLGHPIEGAVSSHIWIHNDRRYRNVEFGRSRDYWMSRLRAYAYAWSLSEFFEIGLFSEASIGQIQRVCCAYGFVDHVITPNAGAVWLIGGDILDKYVVRRIEDHTRNAAVRAVARSVLNPPLSFANVLAGEFPWHRDNRPGVHEYVGNAYIRTEDTQPREIREVPTFELSATLPSILQFDQLSCLGGGGVGAFRVTDSWQWTVEVSGCTFGAFRTNWSGDSLTFSAGPQWISHTSGRWSPHFSMRVGGQKVTQEYVDPILKNLVLAALPPGKNPSSMRHAYAKEYETTGVSLSFSGGADLRLNRALAFRVANFDYIRSWLHPINGYEFNQGYRLSTGLVLRVGTW